MNDIHIDPQRLARAGDIKRLNNRKSKQRHHDQARATALAVVFVAGIITGAAVLAVIMGALQPIP